MQKDYNKQFKPQLTESNIITLRNSRTAVKRAKNEFKHYSNTTSYSDDRQNIINQLSSYNKNKMNLIIK